MLLAGLSTGHQVGLAVVAAIFIGFALSASFLAPRRWPEFPGRNGLPVFIIASVALFAAMLIAVEVFGKESEAKGASEQTVKVSETEYHIGLPAGEKLSPGKTAFVVENAGTVGHNLVIQGPNVPGSTTPLIAPGKSATLTVTLAAGTYTLLCSVDAHSQKGMLAKLTVG